MKERTNYKDCNGVSLTINMGINKDNYDNSSISNLGDDINKLIEEKYNDTFEFINGGSCFIKFDTVDK